MERVDARRDDLEGRVSHIAGFQNVLSVRVDGSDRIGLTSDLDAVLKRSELARSAVKADLSACDGLWVRSPRQFTMNCVGTYCYKTVTLSTIVYLGSLVIICTEIP